MALPQTSSNSSRPPRSLPDLPPELLKEIVKLCSEQDQAYKHRKKLLLEWGRDSEAVELFKAEESYGYGKSLLALSRCCRKLREMSCPYIFQTLEAKDALGKEFRYYIANQHTQHFSHIVFAGCDASDSLDHLFGSLRAFTNLNELTFDDRSTYAIFADAKNTLSAYAFEHLWSIRFKIRTLHLTHLTPDSEGLLRYFNIFPLVKAVSIKGTLPTDTPSVDNFVKKLGKLDELKLDLQEPLPDIYLSPPVPYPPLKRLVISSSIIEHRLVPFLSHFRDSLRELTINLPDGFSFANDAYKDLPDDWIFPNVHTLSITCNYEIAHSLLQPRNFPSVKHLHVQYELRDITDELLEDEALLDQYIDHVKIKTLRHEQFPVEGGELFSNYTRKVYDSLKAKAIERNFELRFQDCPESLYPDFNLAGNNTHYQDRYWGRERSLDLNQVRERFEKVKERLRVAEERIIRDQDESLFKRMMELLGPLEYDRIASLE
ncbi:hypothetical protein JCM5350_005830 [Sporobolomyces pararoseus]